MDVEANPSPQETEKTTKYQKLRSFVVEKAWPLFKEIFFWDGAVMIIASLICYVLFITKPNPARLFPIPSPAPGQDRVIAAPHLAYPDWHFIIPIWAATSIPMLLPIAVFLVLQPWKRSFWDFQNACLGLFYSLVLSSLVQLILKCVVGGLRPNFLAVCKPRIKPGDATGVGFGSMLYNRKVCTGDEKAINFAMTSFPSGHAAAAAACYVYLFFYLNAYFKPWSSRLGSFWRLLLTTWPLLLTLLVTISVVVDYHHHWYDAATGALIGILTALCAYRAV